jgi:hypothetical protein
MLNEVNRRNVTAWRAYTEEMGSLLRKELATTPVGDIMQDLLAEQVDLITSLPWDMARQVQETSMEALETSARYPERTAEIEEALARAHPDATQAWIVNRATLIARTETARAASVLVEARSKYIGANSYVWKTAGDWKVRPSHRACANEDREGMGRGVYLWSKPPLSDPPDHHSHPGQIWNCRCVALPILPE